MNYILCCSVIGVFLLGIGCAEKYSPSPNKPSNTKIRFVTLTNGSVLQGKVQLPLEIKLKSFDGIFLAANGAPISGLSAAIHTNSAGRWFLYWDTQVYPNGIYDIYLEADSGDDSYISATNTITVSNMVSFDAFPFFGSHTNLWIFARLAVQKADWKVKMFDSKDEYIGYFVGVTTNGYISFFWDGTDTSGKTFTNEESFGTEVSVTTPEGSNAPVPTNHPDPSLSNTPPLVDRIPHKMFPREEESQ